MDQPPNADQNEKDDSSLLRVESEDSMPTNMDSILMVHEEFTSEEEKCAAQSSSYNDIRNGKQYNELETKRGAPLNIVIYCFLLTSIYLLLQIKCTIQDSIKEIEAMRSQIEDLKQSVSLEHTNRRNVETELWKRNVLLLYTLPSFEIQNEDGKDIEANQCTIFDILPENMRSSAAKSSSKIKAS
eukprot:400564_1